MLCVLIFFFSKKERKRKITLILFGLLLNSWIVNVPFKELFFRERPYLALDGVKILGVVWENSSFPSGHVAASVTVILIALYLFKIRRMSLAITAIAFIIILGFSRIYLGMHYPSDVLAGVVVGIVSGIIVILIDKQIVFSKKKNIIN